MDDLDIIFTSIRNGKCLPFLGAGACTPYTDKEGNTVSGLPTGWTLAEALAKECDYKNGADFNLLEVAEYFVYKNSGDRDDLVKGVTKELRKEGKTI